MSKWIVDIHGDIEGDYEIIEKYKEPETGRWIDDEFGSKCSCCGIYTHLDKFDRPMKFKCCSMCGAKMEQSRKSGRWKNDKGTGET